MKTSFILIFYLFAAAGCLIQKKSDCLKDYVVNRQFRYLTEGFKNSFFEITDSTQNEFVSGAFYSRSEVKWLDCRRFMLIIQVINDNKGLGVGDTLHVELLNFTKDTLKYAASAFGQKYAFRVVRSK